MAKQTSQSLLRRHRIIPSKIPIVRATPHLASFPRPTLSIYYCTATSRSISHFARAHLALAHPCRSRHGLQLFLALLYGNQYNILTGALPPPRPCQYHIRGYSVPRVYTTGPSPSLAHARLLPPSTVCAVRRGSCRLASLGKQSNPGLWAVLLLLTPWTETSGGQGTTARERKISKTFLLKIK